MLAALLVTSCSIAAGADAPAEEEIPPLIPPRGEIPPTFWEKHRQSVTIISIGGLLGVAGLVGLSVWYVTRPKPPVPPATQALEALGALNGQPENGLLLSRVSQVLRRYVIAAFELPAGELTTAEFCDLVQRQESIGPELSGALSGFLRRCDEYKFAPSHPAQPLGAVARALELVEMGESRRAQLAAASVANAKTAGAGQSATAAVAKGSS